MAYCQAIAGKSGRRPPAPTLVKLRVLRGLHQRLQSIQLLPKIGEVFGKVVGDGFVPAPSLLNKAVNLDVPTGCPRKRSNGVLAISEADFGLGNDRQRVAQIQVRTHQFQATLFGVFQQLMHDDVKSFFAFHAFLKSTEFTSPGRRTVTGHALSPSEVLVFTERTYKPLQSFHRAADYL
jgi:hypothetical protein